MTCVVGVVVTAWAASVSWGGQGPSAVVPEARREAPVAELPAVPHEGPIEVRGRVVDPDGAPIEKDGEPPARRAAGGRLP